MNQKLIALCLLLGATSVSAELPVMRQTNMLPGSRPQASFNGSYKPLVKSMRNGYVQTIQPERVINYGTPRLVEFEGKTYWEVPVTYKSPAAGRGFIISEARALLRDGQVEQWVYVNSSVRVP